MNLKNKKTTNKKLQVETPHKLKIEKLEDKVDLSSVNFIWKN